VSVAAKIVDHGGRAPRHRSPPSGYRDLGSEDPDEAGSTEQFKQFKT